MKRSKTKSPNYQKLIYVFFLLPTHILVPESYPQISALDNSDYIFRQHQEDIKRFYQLAKDKTEIKDFHLSFYEYTTYKPLDFLALSARFNLRPEALATINSITLPQIIKSGTRLLIPNIQAEFVPETVNQLTIKKLIAGYGDNTVNLKDYLVIKDGKLEICSSANQDNPIMPSIGCGGQPIMGIDVWEHAYYLNYQNRRADYVSAFFDIVNWRVVAEKFKNS